MTHTKDKLAEALRTAGLPLLAERAAAGYYDDWQSPLDFPALQLAQDLADENTAAAIKLRAQVIAGDFDGTTEEAEAWADSPEGQAVLDKLVRRQHS